MKKIIFSLLLACSLHASEDFSKELQTQFEGESSYSEALYKQDSYQLHKAWNSLITNSEGIDVAKTFSEDELVVVYDQFSKVWASNKPNHHQLYAKYIEPHVRFFVYAKKAKKVKIVGTKVDGICQKLIDTEGFKSIIDSALTKEFTVSKERTVALNSRYLTHYDRGIYNDTRVMIIYKELATKAKKATLKYGPAEPKSVIKFAKEYEGRKFYMYDFYEKSCYQGLFPSMRIPPFAVLRKIK